MTISANAAPTVCAPPHPLISSPPLTSLALLERVIETGSWFAGVVTAICSWTWVWVCGGDVWVFFCRTIYVGTDSKTVSFFP